MQERCVIGCKGCLCAWQLDVLWHIVPRAFLLSITGIATNVGHLVVEQNLVMQRFSGQSFRLLTKSTRVRILCRYVECWAGSFILHCSSSLSCTNEYLTIANGGYLCTNSLSACSVYGCFTEKSRWRSTEYVCQSQSGKKTAMA